MRQEVRRVLAVRLLENLIQDVRFGLRQLWKSPGFTVVAIMTLALGIGANTAIFTLVHAVMLTSLPVANPEQLYSLGDNQICCDTGRVQDSFTLYSYPLYKERVEHLPGFSEVTAFQSGPAGLSVRRGNDPGLAEPYFGEIVSGNYFSTLGVAAFAGRTLMPEDDRPNAQPVAVLSYRAWNTHYARDPAVIGAIFVINGQPMTVVGITPPGFFGETLRSDPPDFWLPLALEPIVNRDNSLLNRGDVYWLYAIGRLQPGAALGQVQESLKIETQHWLSDKLGDSEQNRQQIAKMHLILTPAGGGISNLREKYSYGLRLLMIVSALVLLIACANIANLLLVRGVARRAQTALRIALGVTRNRLIRQMLTEGVLLAVLGGIAGIGVAFAGTKLLLLLAFSGSKYVPIDATPSLPVLGFAFATSLITGAVLSIVPAWITSHANPAELMRGAGRSTRDRTALPQKALVVLQAGLSVVLLVGAGLLTQSLRNLENQQFGFATQGRLMVSINPGQAGYTPERLPLLYRRLEDRLKQIPGVLSSSIALHSPMDDWNWSFTVYIDGHPPTNDSPASRSAQYDRIGAHYFETIGTRVLRGRPIGEEDTPTSHHVAVINQSFANKFFPNEDPIGKHMGLGDVSHSGDYEIVGIVEDTKYRDAKSASDPMFFFPLLQMAKYQPGSRLDKYQTWATYIDGFQLRVAGRPETFQTDVRRALAEVDPNLTVIDMMTFDERVSRSFNSERLIARLTTLFGVLALVLASVGLYGVASYTVARRTNEIGIRMALGAGRARLISLVLRGAMAPISVGMLIGIPCALAGGYALANQLFGVKRYDPFVMAAAVGVLTVCALLAAIAPARRAASIDPIRALRSD
jgi:macrolide transport system ATP-binding/permease protein